MMEGAERGHLPFLGKCPRISCRIQGILSHSPLWQPSSNPPASASGQLCLIGMLDAPDIQRLLKLHACRMDMGLVRKYFRLFNKEGL